ncbi:hypothetical protein JNJ66_00545 [Candidatus Saccharibacteria bacterium]|nr:hypothetical protein [Candidatus Saccharibacteria bacterium]
MAKQKPVAHLHIIVIVAGVLALQVATLSMVWIQHIAAESRFDKIEERLALQLPTSDDEAFGSKPVVAPAEKRVYLPELGLYLPMTHASLDARYRVTDHSGGGTQDVVFTSGTNYSLQSEDASDDRCVDLVRLEIGAQQSQPRSDETTLDPFKLKDGRMVYGYVNNAEKLCHDEWIVTPAQVADVVKQLQSY